MFGRLAGSPGEIKVTDYIARELRAIGLEPAGDNGSFFQAVPLSKRLIPDSTVSLSLGSQLLVPFLDYLPRFNGADARKFSGAATVYGGLWGDTAAMITADQAAGKVVVIGMPIGIVAVVKAQLEQRFASASAIAVANLDLMTPAVREVLSTAAVPENPGGLIHGNLPAYIHISSRVMEQAFGAPIGRVSRGAVGQPLHGDITYVEHTFTARNVVAVLRGSDKRLKNQYIALGAHTDHEGIGAAVDADSARAYNLELRKRQTAIESGRAAPGGEVLVNMDSIRLLHPEARFDSIYNGADDDGSGIVAMIEIARAMSRGSNRPRRSILFVFHAAEEEGLLGSAHFSEQPSVPMDSIVAQINLDMIGRGGAVDEPRGGPNYLQVIGARRMSEQLGDLLETVSREKGYNWSLDTTLDAAGHPEQLFCRSDHFNYARFGIPVAFITTGLHADYHQVTDEPEWIDYDKLARVSAYVRDLVDQLANRDTRLTLTQPKPSPRAPCVH
jgi:hypothetical protein